jgi:hypothetical protein
MIFSSFAQSGEQTGGVDAIAVWVDEEGNTLKAVVLDDGFETVSTCIESMKSFAEMISESGKTMEIVQKVPGAVDVLLVCVDPNLET